MRYRDVDMNAIPRDLRDFDFTWSSCALEHLGTLAAGMDFVVNQMACLGPEGRLCTRTEYLVSSNDVTVEAGARSSTGAATSSRWSSACGGRATPSTSTTREGTTPEDLHVDVPPYTDVHLRTRTGRPRDDVARR